MGQLLKLAVLLASLQASAIAMGEELVTEVIPLGYRSVTEILPILRPLVPPPGTVAGLYTTLVIKSDVRTIEAVKQILRELDRAPQNLMVTVRHGISDSLRRSEGEAAIVIDQGDVRLAAGGLRQGGALASGSDGASRAGVRVFDTRSTTRGREVQRLRVLEGHQAFIRVGESVPLAQRSIITFGGITSVQDSIEYRDVTSGFYVRPRLSGDRVLLEISPHRAQLSARGGGAIDIQEATTTVSGRLGDWIPIGGHSNQAQHSGAETLYSTRAYETETRSLFLKVDLVD